MDGRYRVEGQEVDGKSASLIKAVMPRSFETRECIMRSTKHRYLLYRAALSRALMVAAAA